MAASDVPSTAPAAATRERRTDPLTGLPVLRYRFVGTPTLQPGDPAPEGAWRVLRVERRSDGTVVDLETQSGAEVVAAAAIDDAVVAAALATLEDARALGVAHGDLGPHRLWRRGDRLWIDGYGIPWRPGATVERDAHDLADGLLALDGTRLSEPMRARLAALRAAAGPTGTAPRAASASVGGAADDGATSGDPPLDEATAAASPPLDEATAAASPPLDEATAADDGVPDAEAAVGDGAVADAPSEAAPPSEAAAPSEAAPSEAAPPDDATPSEAAPPSEVAPPSDATPSEAPPPATDDPDEPAAAAAAAADVPSHPPSAPGDADATRAAAPRAERSAASAPRPAAPSRLPPPAPPRPVLRVQPAPGPTLPKRPEPLRRRHVLLAIALALSAATWALLASWSQQRPAAPTLVVRTVGHVVDVRIEPAGMPPVSLHVVESPPGSRLPPGALVGSVPSKVLLDRTGVWRFEARFGDRRSPIVALVVPNDPDLTLPFPTLPQNAAP